MSRATSPATGGDLVRRLLEARSAHLADIERRPAAAAAGEGERLLVRSDLEGSMQLYELAGGVLRQLTRFPEPVGAALYLPGSRRAVVEVDRGGNERYQLQLLELDADADADADADVPGQARLVPLTDDPEHGHHLAGVSPNGTLVAYVSNKRNGVDYDLWLCEPGSGDHRLLFAAGSYLQPSGGFSPDGRFVTVLRPGPRPLDHDLLLVEVATGRARPVLAHPGEAAQVGWPAFAGRHTLFVSSDVGRDFAAAVALDGEGKGSPRLLSGSGEDAGAVPAASEDGSTLVVSENRNGASRLAVLPAVAGDLSAGREVPLPGTGSIELPVLVSPDGSSLYFTLSTPRLAGDVFAYRCASGRTERLTESPAGVPAERLVEPECHEVTSFDGERIPLFLYRPAEPAGPPPVVVLVHGGPESQSTRQFHPVVQSLACLGFAVAVPNVRGSTGYGKRYAALDDTTRRLDAVRDLEAVHGWLVGAGLDSRRAALWGGSYGGYMVLAGLAFQPQLWAAGVDIVGISDLVTFLENTSSYRRAFREREYGSLERDRDFLAAASPLRRVDQIRAPLFVIHGRNDPRVPLSEAEQLVAALRRRAVRVELRVYDDEGHGLNRLANRLDAYPQALAFLAEVLGGPDPGT